MEDNIKPSELVENEEIVNLPHNTLIKNFQELITKSQQEQEKISEQILKKLRSVQEKIEEKSNELAEKITEQIQFIRINQEKCNREDQQLTEEEQIEQVNRLSLSDSLPDENGYSEMSFDGKQFKMKHIFKNVSNMKEGDKLYSETEEHFGVPWRIHISRSLGLISFSIQCTKPTGTEKWSIETECQHKLSASVGQIHVKRLSHTFHVNQLFETNKSSEWGLAQVVGYAELEKDFMNDGKLIGEVHVNITKMEGIYKKNLRCFDSSVAEFSDVVLNVKGTKFYISKLYLAAHSSYFKSLFLGCFQESKKSEISLTGIDPDDFQNYLELLYGEPSINESTVEGLLLVADMYDTHMVIEKSKDFLLKVSYKTLRKKLELATRYNLIELKRKCLAEIKTVQNIKSVIPGDIHDLDPLIMAELFERSLALHEAQGQPQPQLLSTPSLGLQVPIPAPPFFNFR